MAKKYKCMYCEKRLIRKDLINHIYKSHKELIPENYTAARLVYNQVNKVEYGKCRVCGKETQWSEKSGRYDVLCGNPKCKEHMREEYKKNMLRVKGTYNILNDPEQQKKMLANRSISGQYKFQDGGVLIYTGSYEKKCLEFMDIVMQIPSKDILSPGPTLEYEYNGQKHFYIADFYYIPYNLIIEVKDGGSNLNTKDSASMRASREKTIEKERIITDKGEYNYIRLTNNNFTQLIEVFMDIKEKLLRGDDSKTYKINESQIILEDYFVDKKDIYYNKDKFDSGEINLCFITGLSGSGKTTMGKTMQSGDIEVYGLDDIISNWDFSDANLKEYGGLVYSFFKGPGKTYRYTSYDEWMNDSKWDNPTNPYVNSYDAMIIKDFVKYAKSYANSHKNIKFVLEGVWVFHFIDPKELDSYAVYIKGASALISFIRAAKRDCQDANSNMEKFGAFIKIVTSIDRMKAYLSDEKRLLRFYEYFASKVINESQIIAEDYNASKHSISNIKNKINKIHQKYLKDKKQPTGNQNCLLCTWCIEAWFRDIEMMPRPIYSPTDIAFKFNAYDIVKNPELIKFRSKEDFKRVIRSSGNGSRYYVHVKWNGGSGGHEFMAIDIDNIIYIIDAQQGIIENMDTSYMVKDYFNINYDESYMVRLDNKQFNKELLKYNNSKYIKQLTEDDMKMLEENAINESQIIAEDYFDEVNRLSKFIRITYGGEGIYQAFKESVPFDVWKSFKNSNAVNWLPLPPSYESNYRSYFTTMGYKMFMKKTYPVMIKYLDKSKIKIEEVYLQQSNIIYEDKFQVVISEDNTINESQIILEDYFVDKKDIDIEEVFLNLNKYVNNVHLKYLKDKKKYNCNYNCGICTLCIEAWFRGIIILPRPIYNNTLDVMYSGIYSEIIKNPEPIIFFKNKDELKRILLSSGNNSRYIVHIAWKNTEHECMAVVVNDDIYIIDAQQGLIENIDSAKMAEYFNYYINKNRSFVIRIDDKQFNTNLLIKYNDDKYIKQLIEDDMKMLEEDAIDESLEDVSGIVFGKRKLIQDKYITLYHGTSIKDLPWISPLSGNVGLKNAKPKMSSFWFNNLDYAITFSTMDYIARNLNDKDACKSMVLDNDMKVLIDNKYKSKVIASIKNGESYVYERTVESKYVGYGHNGVFPEYTLDIPVKPDRYYVIKFEDMINKIKFVSETYIKSIKQKYADGKMDFGANKMQVLMDRVFYYSGNTDRADKAKQAKAYSKISFNDILDLNKMLNQYEYIIPNNGDIITQISEDSFNKYKLLSPDEFKKYKGGICWDYVVYEAYWFDKYFTNIPYSVYFEVFDNKTDCPTHTFLIFEYGGKYYWFESSWKPMCGIYGGFDTEKDAVDYVMSKLNDSKSNYKNYICKYDPLDSKMFGMNSKQFMDYLLPKVKPYKFPNKVVIPTTVIKGTTPEHKSY